VAELRRIFFCWGWGDMSDESSLVDGTATNTDGTSTACIAAQGAGYRTVLTDVTISNSSATAVEVTIKDGSTARWTFPVPANVAGVVYQFRGGLRGTANAAWNFDPSAAATTITCSMAGYRERAWG